MCCLAILSARAQLYVDLVLDQTQFLPREDLLIGVRIKNLSGQTLEMGKDNKWIHFMVEHVGSGAVDKSGEIPAQGIYKIENSKMVTRYLNLAAGYYMYMPGRYKVVAVVTIPEWNRTITSAPADFEIIRGATLWEQGFGVPKMDGETNAVPKFRQYILQQTSSMDQLRLYACVAETPSKQMLRVTYVGPMMSFSLPEAQLDKDSNLHLLYQSGAKAFIYTTINPNGNITLRHTYLYTATRPALRKDEEFGIRVIGGIRRHGAGDVPSENSDILLSTNAIPVNPK